MYGPLYPDQDSWDPAQQYYSWGHRGQNQDQNSENQKSQDKQEQNSSEQSEQDKKKSQDSDSSQSDNQEDSTLEWIYQNPLFLLVKCASLLNR